MDKQLSTNETKKEKSLADIALVTYLVCENFEIVRIDKPKQSTGKSFFVFNSTDELNAAILKFFNKQARVEPNLFHETLRNLKSYARQA